MFRNISKSPTLKMHELSQQKSQAGDKIYKFGFGQSPFGPTAQMCEDLAKNASAHFYAPIAGIPELRSQIAKFVSHYDQTPCDADQVLVNAGSKIMLYAMMAAFDKAEIIIPAPTWVSYAPQAELIGHKIIPLQTTRENAWRVTPELLQQAIDQGEAGVPKILILTYPGNPDSLSYGGEMLAEIAETARKNDIYILSDEIYSMLTFDGSHQSIAKYYPEKTVRTGGISKWAGAGGWRLGHAILPKEHIDDLGATMIGVLSELVSCASAPTQLAAICAYEVSQENEDDMKHRRRILKLAGDYTYEVLSKAGININRPVGGFYAFVDFMDKADAAKAKGLTSSAAFCEALLNDTGVAFLSGEGFGMAESYLTARLSYVDFDGDTALKASKEIGLNTELNHEFMAQYMPNIIEAVDKTAAWFEAL